MRLTMMTDYALRLLMYVGQRPDQLCTIAEVAGAHGISEAHLMKITHQLALHGWLETIRGRGGGMRLATTPDQVNIGAVVRRMEPDFQLVECLARDTCALAGHCNLTPIVEEALELFMAHLDRHTLADLLPGIPIDLRAQRKDPTSGGGNSTRCR